MLLLADGLIGSLSLSLFLSLSLSLSAAKVVINNRIAVQSGNEILPLLLLLLLLLLLPPRLAVWTIHAALVAFVVG
jgi:hypothetical protein